MDQNQTEPAFHRKLAVELFNAARELLDRKDRTAADDRELLGRVHTSRLHWSRVGTPLESAHGNQVISHVYAGLNEPSLALRCAQSTLELCEKNGIGDFDLAFAYEAMARAHAAAGHRDEVTRYVKLARDAATRVARPEDRDCFLSVLKTVPAA